MKRNKIFIFMILIILLSSLFLHACSLIKEKEAYRNDYYAKLIDQPSTMKANFISNNKIKCTEPYDASRP